MKLSTISITALAATVSANPITDPISRNTTATAASPLYLFMKPAITSPQCGGLYTSTFSVQYAEDEFYLSTKCQSFLDLIGGMKGKKDADVLFMCADGKKTEGTGDDEDKMKVVFYPSSKGMDVVGGDLVMQVTSMPDDLVLALSAELVGKEDDDELVFGSVVCN